MALDFRGATEALFDRVRVEDLAGELHCSPQTIKQARMEADTKGRRTPPEGWQSAAAKLAKKRSDQLRRLADKLAAG
jgi:hypothetical protein